MNYSEEVTGAPLVTEVSQELLEEMLWFFRVEDGKWSVDWWVVGCALGTKRGIWLKPPCHGPLLCGRPHISSKAGTEAEGADYPEGSG